MVEEGAMGLLLEALQKYLAEYHVHEVAGRKQLFIAHPAPGGKGVLIDKIDLGDAPVDYAKSVQTEDLDALALYTARHCDTNTIIFADTAYRTVQARLDYGGESMPLRDQHRASCALKLSPELLGWLGPGYERTVLMDQVAFAQHLREHAGDVEGDAAQLMELSLKFSVTSNDTLLHAHVEQSGDVDIAFKTNSKPVSVKLPEGFTLAVPLYQGAPPRAIRALFLYRVDRNTGALKLGWRLIGLDTMLREEFLAEVARFKIALVAALKDAAVPPLYFGAAT